MKPDADELCADLVGVGGVLRLDHHAQHRGLRRGVHQHAVVADFQDVAARFADEGRDLREDAGAVLDLDDDGEHAALAREFAQDHVRQQAHVDIAAREQHADLACL